jgi:hypothetical protein
MLLRHGLLVAAALVWIGFTAWTIRWLTRASHGDSSPLVFRLGVRAVGATMWLASVIVPGTFMLEDGARGVDFWAWISAFGLFFLPISLWGGYLWGRAMDAFLSSRRR